MAATFLALTLDFIPHLIHLAILCVIKSTDLEIVSQCIRYPDLSLSVILSVDYSQLSI